MAVVEREVSEHVRRFRGISYSDTQIGQLLRRAGRVKDSDIPRIVKAQQEMGLRFGDAALALGLVKEIDIQAALSRQYDYPYLQPGEGAFSRAIVAAHQPFSPPAEAFRALRTQLVLRWFKDRGKVLAVVGARPGAGTSTLAANLAVVFAQLGERTLIIDANLRQPSQEGLFGLRPQLGLAGVLTGRSACTDAPREIAAFPNLFLIGAGPSVPNPQELLGRSLFSYLVETAPVAFDVVIVDCPPVLDYADAQVIAAAAKGCLMVARRHHSRVDDLKLAQDRLVQSGGVVLGSVICG